MRCSRWRRAPRPSTGTLHRTPRRGQRRPRRGDHRAARGGADASATDQFGNTAPHHAAANGAPAEVITALLEAGRTRAPRTSSGTPHCTTPRPTAPAEVITALLEAGATRAPRTRTGRRRRIAPRRRGHSAWRKRCARRRRRRRRRRGARRRRRRRRRRARRPTRPHPRPRARRVAPALAPLGLAPDASRCCRLADGKDHGPRRARRRRRPRRRGRR